MIVSTAKVITNIATGMYIKSYLNGEKKQMQ